MGRRCIRHRTQIKLMKQRKSENADNTKQNNRIFFTVKLYIWYVASKGRSLREYLQITFPPHNQSAILTPTLPPPTQCSVPHRQCLHQSFILLFHPAPSPVVYGWPVHPTFILNDVPYHSTCYSLIAVCPPHTLQAPIPLEYAPTTHPPLTQRCEAHRQSLYQPFGHVYPLSPSPSPISFCIPVVHSSRNTFRVVYSPKSGTLVTHPSITISMLYSCSPHFHRIFCEDSPPHTLPPPTQGSVPHRHSLHQSFDHPYLLSPCHHPSISVYLPSTHSTCDRTIHTLPASIPRGPTPLQKQFIVVYLLSTFPPHYQNGIPARNLPPPTQYVYTIANAYTNHSAWYSLPLPVRHPSIVIYPRPTSPTMHLEWYTADPPIQHSFSMRYLLTTPSVTL
ncbi:hypothetical protein T08_15029 [Trichinella sp. T8]|nr:hypothetical protein T08_15029 [Trichinella sp. T8]